MQIMCDQQGNLSSTWYNKPTDTGLILNYHALAPRRYKQSVVSGFVHRIARACSTWEHFHSSIVKAKQVLERNQYPPSFYEPIIEKTITTIIQPKDTITPNDSPTNTTNQTQPSQQPEKPTVVQKKMIFIQYRGKVTENYARALHRCEAPCTIVMTLRKLKTTLPSLKPSVEKHLRSGAVYQISCPVCQDCYIGQTVRRILTRFKEHCAPSQPVRKHFAACEGAELTFDNMDILKTSSRGEQHLLTLEALFIAEKKPKINTKDEYRSRMLTIRLY